MEIDVHFTAAAAAKADAPPRAVVIDVLRATTTIAWALHAGVEGIWPAYEVDEARELAKRLRAEQKGRVLLAGERGNNPLPDFDLGNSPAALVERDMRGQQLVITTSNGTRAIAAVAQARQVYTLSLANLEATAVHLVAAPELTIVCAGTDLGRSFSLEDALCAGALVQRLAEHRLAQGLSPPELSDRARFSLDAARGGSGDWSERLRQAKHGRRLLHDGFADDVALAARADALSVVAALREGRIVDIAGA